MRGFWAIAAALSLAGLLGAQASQPAPSASPALDTVVSEKPAARDSARVNARRADTVLVVKHQFRHREQIIAGSAVMAALAGILVIMNNYNPR